MIFILAEKGLSDFLLVININFGLISHCLATIQPWPTDERTHNRRIVHAAERVKKKEFASGGQSSITQTVYG